MYYLNRFFLLVKKNQFESIILLLLLLILLPYFLLFGYCHPAGDDYSYAVLGSKPNFKQLLLDEYNLWNGRYSSNIFVLKGTLVYFHNSLLMYRISIFLIFILFYFSIDRFLRLLLGKNIDKKNIALFSISIFVLFLYQMPILSEGIYWYTGVVTYLLGIIFFLWLISLQIRFLNKVYLISKHIHFGILIALAFFTVGFNEVLMLHVFFLYFGWTYLSIIKFKENRFTFIVLLTIIFASILIVYFAPGNTIRSSYFVGKSHQLLHSLLFSVLQCCRFTFEWLSNGVILLLSIVFISIHPKFEKHVFIFSSSFPISKWVSLFSLPAVIFISVFPAYWSTGILGQHRTMNVAYFFFIFLWFLNLSIWINSYPQRFSRFNFNNSKLFVLFSLVIILTTKNTRIGWIDILTKSVNRFDLEMNERYKALDRANIKANLNSKVYISKLNERPKSIFLYDISNDPNYFPNVCYRKYWKIKGYIYTK